MPLIMSTGTMVLGLYLALAGGAEIAAFGWLVFALGVLGVAARMLLPVDRPRR